MPLLSFCLTLPPHTASCEADDEVYSPDAHRSRVAPGELTYPNLATITKPHLRSSTTPWPSHGTTFLPLRCHVGL